MSLSHIPIKKKLSEEVRLRLEEMIREEVYPVGTSLPPEREIMELFGVGRPSVREALYSLDRMGMLQLGNGERAKVTRPDAARMLASLSGAAAMMLEAPDGVANFEQVRLFMETGIARHLAEQADASTVEKIRASLARNQQTLDKARAFATTDIAFHRTLAELTANPIFVATHDALVEWLIARRPTPPDPPRSNRSSFEGHVAIVEAIAAHDPDTAASAMRMHLEKASARYAAL